MCLRTIKRIRKIRGVGRKEDYKPLSARPLDAQAADVLEEPRRNLVIVITASSSGIKLFASAPKRLKHFSLGSLPIVKSLSNLALMVAAPLACFMYVECMSEVMIIFIP